MFRITVRERGEGFWGLWAVATLYKLGRAVSGWWAGKEERKKEGNMKVYSPHHHAGVDTLGGCFVLSLNAVRRPGEGKRKISADLRGFSGGRIVYFFSRSLPLFTSSQQMNWINSGRQTDGRAGGRTRKQLRPPQTRGGVHNMQLQVGRLERKGLPRLGGLLVGVEAGFGRAVRTDWRLDSI